jgi:hypothetical protein
MTQAKRDIAFAAAAIALCGAAILWMPREAPKPCGGPVQELFWSCVKSSVSIRSETRKPVDN